MFASNIFTTRRAHVVSFIRAIIPLPDGERFNFCHAHGVITGLSLILFANECTSVFSSQTLCSVLLHRGLRTQFSTKVARSSLPAALPLGTGGFIPAEALPLTTGAFSRLRLFLSPLVLPLCPGSFRLHWRFLAARPRTCFQHSLTRCGHLQPPHLILPLLQCSMLLPQMASAQQALAAPPRKSATGN